MCMVEPVTGTWIIISQAAAQVGMGLSIFAKAAVIESLRKAPSQWELPELPMYPIVNISTEQKESDTREVFISYFEGELNNIWK